MAINIFQGSKPTKAASKVNAANRTTRAKAVQAALSTPSVTSDSGATAVGKSGTLQKVGNIVGKVAGIASKFLPGIGGTIASGISNLLNDPEWWQSVPGEAVTCNAPLRVIENGQVPNGDNTGKVAAARFRVAMLEIHSTTIETSQSTDDIYAITPTDQMINSYLLPQIRKVVNAIPLQTVASYKEAFAVNATLYAIWVNLKKYDYLCKHGLTYIANLDDPTFPILQVKNAALLQSTIGRLEEYLRSNVRLPHTLCEYLAWRFGRIYRSNDSAKAALVMYNVFTMKASVEDLSTRVSRLMSIVSSSTELQKASADLYNTYFDHDYQVEIREDTQVTFDRKEFCLRTNLDLPVPAGSDENDASPDCVYIDSNLDNPTTFMASTVSTRGQVTGPTGAYDVSILIPVRGARVYIPVAHSDLTDQMVIRFVNIAGQDTGSVILTANGGSAWGYRDIYSLLPSHTPSHPTRETADTLANKLVLSMICKAVDFYNKDIYVMASLGQGGPFALDVTSLSMDMGLVQNQIIGNEHLFAFANLVDIERKHSMSYKQAETLVARDTANLVEKLDIATVK
jgi:hypothetical protein